jgi:hypothetical protein
MDDADIIGKIIFEAFSPIADEHGFPITGWFSKIH